MPVKEHTVVTRDYPENLSRGIMICGYNYGFSREEEAREEAGIFNTSERKSFFSDQAVNKTPYRNKLVSLFHAWGIRLETEEGRESAFERSFFQTNWLSTQSRNISDEEKITVDTLVAGADGFLQLIAERKPRVILFVGRNLIEALNDIRIRDRVEQILGKRPGNAVVHYSESSTGGVRFKVLTQQFPNAVVVGIPHVTGTRGLTNDYMHGFGDLMRGIFLDQPSA